MPPPASLPNAILSAADRLIATLMTLIDAVAPVALAGGTPTLPDHTAQTLFFRLAHLVTTLIRMSNFGIRAPATKPAASPARLHPSPIAPRPPPGPAQALPRRPGWILDALPDLAPAIAADVAVLLADPALATLLATAPTLHRALRPLLRGLGLTQPPPSSTTPPPTTHRPEPHHAAKTALAPIAPSHPALPRCHAKSAPLTDRRSVPYLLRFSNI